MNTDTLSEKPLRFAGRAAIVTGAARGIGRAICLELAHQGCDVAFSYSQSSIQAEELAAHLAAMKRNFYCCRAPVQDFAAADAMVKEVIRRFGRVDYLVNNAGIIRDKLILRMSEKDWDEVLAVNLKGAFNCTKAVVPLMLKARFGSILNITSISGLVGMPGQVNYSASKAGLIGFTKSLAKELASRNITVNALALGFIESEMTQSLTGEQRANILKSLPLGRFGRTSEVACVAAFLLSDDARYITGQVIQMDGGLAM